MSNGPVSPAVQSLLDEQSRQTAKRKSGLEKGLEDTFPASDPVAVTSTVTAGGTDAETSEPLGLHPTGYADRSHHAQLRALRGELASLRERAGEMAAGAKASARSEVKALERMVAEKPLMTLGMVAAASFLIGALSRRGYDD